MTTFGPTIIHDGGNRPQWISQTAQIRTNSCTGLASSFHWPSIKTYQLVQGHWAYKPLGAGMTPLPLGMPIPKDFDPTGKVMMQNGSIAPYHGDLSLKGYTAINQRKMLADDTTLDPATIRACIAKLDDRLSRERLEALLPPEAPLPLSSRLAIAARAVTDPLPGYAVPLELWSEMLAALVASETTIA